MPCEHFIFSDGFATSNFQRIEESYFFVVFCVFLADEKYDFLKPDFLFLDS
jgi:hypothetical protein